MTIKHILFDLDGTLVDSANSILTSYELLFKEFKLEPKVALSQSIIGPPLKETLSMLTNSNDESLIELMVVRFKIIYDSIVAENTPIFESVEKLLTSLLNKNIHLYIVTNKREIPTLKVIAHYKWESFFGGIYSIDTLEDKAMNKTKLIAHVLNKYSITHQEALYVGDTRGDLEAAEANDIDFLAVSWGYGHWGDAQHPVIYEPLSLLNIIAKNTC